MSPPATAVAARLERFVEATRRPPKEPYRSLEPFRFSDASILAARDDEVERLVRLITMYRGVLLYGETGAGKTSILNAGLLPRLIEDGFWPHRVRVQPPPAGGLALEPIVCSDSSDDRFLPSAFATAGETGQLVLAADEFVDAVSAAAGSAPIVLIFDQFEELVTLFPKAAEPSDAQSAIMDAIVTLLRGGVARDADEHAQAVRVKLLLAFREDYLAGLKPLLEQYPDLVHQGLRLVAPPRSCAQQIVRAPFDTFPGYYRPELGPELCERIARLLAEHHEGGLIPLTELQIVCSRLWHSADPGTLLGDRGISGLLEDHTEEALSQFSGGLRDAAVAVLGRLVTASNTRNVVTGPDLVQLASEEDGDLDPDVIREAIRRLEAESGLIRRERRHDIDLYELTSEFLIPWVSRQRDEVRAARKAERARVEQEQLRRQRVRRMLVRYGLGVIAVVLIVFAALSLAALHERNRAQQAASAARRSAATSADLELAQSALGIRPDASLVLALAAFHDNPGLQGVRSSMVAALEQAASSPATGILHGFDSTVTSVAFDPRNPDELASAGADGTILLWNTARRTVAARVGVAGAGVSSLAFSGDGRTLVTGGQDGTIRLWSVSGATPIGAPLQLHQGIVSSVAFSPDRRWIAAAGLDAGIDLVKVANGSQLASPTPLRGSDSVRSIAFSPNSGQLVSVGSNRGTGGTIALWNVAAANAAPQSWSAPVPLYAVAFDPSRRADEVAAAGRSGDVYLWPLADPAPSTQTAARGASINSLAYSPDGRWLAAGTGADSIQLFSATTGSPVGAPLTGHDGTVTTVAFSADSRTLASGSTDETIRLWPIPPHSDFGRAVGTNLGVVHSVAFTPAGWAAAGGQSGITLWPTRGGDPVNAGTSLSGVVGVVQSLAFSPHGNLMASGSSKDGSVQLWTIPGGTLDKTLPSRTAVYAVAFSPDGRTLAVAGSGNTITLLDPTTGGTRHALNASRVFALAFSPNGAILASGGDYRTINLWNAHTGQPIGALVGNGDAIFSLAFASNQVLASGSADGTVRLWNVAARTELGAPLQGGRYIRSVRFSPSGAELASGASNGTIRFWSVASRTQLGQPLSATSQALQSVAFSPDGRYLLSGGNDGATRIWPVVELGDYSTLRRSVCSLIGTGLSRPEWQQFAPPTASYQNPCG